jgi:glutathione S-transferase
LSLTLVIGTRRWSSWSLRPWLALKVAEIPFEERLIPLRQPDTMARILEYSPAGKVPVLIDGTDLVWESLAILDYLAQRFPGAALWPDDLSALALARSVAAEMHAGFPGLRRELSMDVTVTVPTPELSPQAQADVDRVLAIWAGARARFGRTGPFLFGRFSNADAMFAPVVTRFQTYQVRVDPICRDYMDAILGLPAMVEWYRSAAEDDG